MAVVVVIALYTTQSLLCVWPGLCSQSYCVHMLYICTGCSCSSIYTCEASSSSPLTALTLTTIQPANQSYHPMVFALLCCPALPCRPPIYPSIHTTDDRPKWCCWCCHYCCFNCRWHLALNLTKRGEPNQTNQPNKNWTDWTFLGIKNFYGKFVSTFMKAKDKSTCLLVFCTFLSIVAR